MSDETNVFCSACQAELAETFIEPARKDEPCPSCGSTRRLVQIISEEALDRTNRPIREMVRTKIRMRGGKKPILEEVSGDDWSRSRAKWVQLDRVLDRANDHYQERVVDLDSGEVIHECDEPLSEHRGHGAARPGGNSGT
jgi:hypothetical protein